MTNTAKTMYSIDFADINSRALEQAESIFEEMGMEGVVHGKEYVCLNPNRKEDSGLGSFKFNLETGAWADFAVGDEAKGIGMISYVAYVKRTTDYNAPASA